MTDTPLPTLRLSRAKAEDWSIVTIRLIPTKIRAALAADALTAHDLLARTVAAEAELKRVSDWSQLRALDIMTLGAALGKAEVERDRYRTALLEIRAGATLGKNAEYLAGIARAALAPTQEQP